MGRATTALKEQIPWIAPALILLLVVLAGTSGSPTIERNTVAMLVNLVIVIGLYMFVGNTGIMSFGHISFMVIGAYVTALLTIPPVQKSALLSSLPDWLQAVEMAPVPAALAAAGAAALFALLLSIPLMRLSGVSAAIATFAVLLIVNNVATNWSAVTRGDSTMIGVPANTTAASAYVWVLVVIAVAYAFQRSATGLRLRASREDDVAARAVGIDIVMQRRIAFVASAAVVGLGGFLYAQLFTSFTPESFYLGTTFFTIAMLVVGGVRSLSGAVIGTIAVSAALELLRELERGVSVGGVEIPARPGLSAVGIGALLVIMLLLRPNGLTNGRELSWPRLRRVPRLKHVPSDEGRG